MARDDPEDREGRDEIPREEDPLERDDGGGETRRDGEREETPDEGRLDGVERTSEPRVTLRRGDAVGAERVGGVARGDAVGAERVGAVARGDGRLTLGGAAR